MPRDGHTTLRWLVVAALVSAVACRVVGASEVAVVYGWLEAAEDSDFVMRAGPGEGVQFEIDDPLAQFVGTLPDYHRLTVRWKVLEDTGLGIPKVDIASVHPPETMVPRGLSCGIDPARFASCYGVPGSAPSDSDRDGVPDYQDDFPFDPSEDTDTDGDGTGNNADDDDDGDLMLDLYELANGLDTLVDDSAGDLDGDGQSNLAESVAGTFANSGASYFRIQQSRRLGGVGVRLVWDALPGRTYRILYAPDPLSQPTEVASGISVASPGPASEDLPARLVRGFYFVEAELNNSP